MKDANIIFCLCYYSFLRFPFDVYDRIWSPFNFNEWTQISTNYSFEPVGESGLQLPSIVMQTASTSKDTSKPLEIGWDPIDSSQYYVLMHLAEVLYPEVNQSREFIITNNDNFVFGPIIPNYLSSVSILPNEALEGASRHVISFISTEKATLPPIINAFELYIVKNISKLEADQGDGISL